MGLNYRNRRQLFSLLLALLLLLGGCASTEKPVTLTYERSVKTSGGEGEIFLAGPAEKMDALRPTMLPGGRMILGVSRETNADIVTRQSVFGWVADALAEELRSAGYTVRIVSEVPRGVEKGLTLSILALSADQLPKVVTLSTVVEIKLSVELFRKGDLLKTLTAGVRDEEEAFDRSSEPIRKALQKSLQRVMQELVPDIVTTLR